MSDNRLIAGEIEDAVEAYNEKCREAGRRAARREIDGDELLAAVRAAAQELIAKVYGGQ